MQRHYSRKSYSNQIDTSNPTNYLQQYHTHIYIYTIRSKPRPYLQQWEFGIMSQNQILSFKRTVLYGKQ